MKAVRGTIAWAIAVAALAAAGQAAEGDKAIFLKVLVPADAQVEFDGLTEQEALHLGTEAYVYGYPLITMEMTRRVMTNAAEPKGGHAPMGQFHNSRTYPSASFRDVTAPNADTLYSAAWLDVAKEPYVLTLPDERARHYLVPILSA